MAITTSPLLSGLLSAAPALRVGVIANDPLLLSRIVAVLEEGGHDVEHEHGSAPPLVEAHREVPLEAVVAVPDGDGHGGPDARGNDLAAAGCPLVSVIRSEDRVAIRHALRNGADGVVLASRLAETLCPTLHAVHAGQRVLPRDNTRRGRGPLSYREREVLGLVCGGLTNQEVASELCLTESTVKTHVSTIFRKLDVHSRAEAIALALDPQESTSLSLPMNTSRGRFARILGVAVPVHERS